jgi:ATP-binding cassette subfamily D (ALD) long-chain fatty acid import protein
MHVERELQELRERLSQVEKWKARHEEIEKELSKVWVEGGDEIAPPPYVEKEAREERDVDPRPESAEETQDEAEYQEAQEEVGETDVETEVGDAEGDAAGVESSTVVV